MAVIARTLTFDQRQTEDWPCWQIWPIVCVLQLCFLDEDSKTNIFGSRPVIIKIKEMCLNGHFGGSGPIHQNFGEGLPVELEQKQELF